MAEDTLKARIDSFMKEYGDLTKKYAVDFISYPTFAPNEKGGWDLKIQTHPIDTTTQKKEEPLFPEKK